MNIFSNYFITNDLCEDENTGYCYISMFKTCKS